MISEAILQQRRNYMLRRLSEELRSIPFQTSYAAVMDGTFPLPRLYLEMIGRQVIANDWESLRDGRQYALLQRSVASPIGAWAGSISGGFSWRRALRASSHRFHESILSGDRLVPRRVPTPEELGEGSNAVSMRSHIDIRRDDLLEALGYQWLDVSWVAAATVKFPVPSNNVTPSSLRVMYDTSVSPINIGFDVDVLEYSVPVPANVGVVTVFVNQPEGASVRMRVSELEWADASVLGITMLPVGATRLQIEITAQDQWTQRNYYFSLEKTS